MPRAVELIAGWCRRQPIEGFVVQVIEHPRRTPIIWAEVAGAGSRKCLLFRLRPLACSVPLRTARAPGAQTRSLLAQ
jgi:hypothetical protein